MWYWQHHTLGCWQVKGIRALTVYPLFSVEIHADTTHCNFHLLLYKTYCRLICPDVHTVPPISLSLLQSQPNLSLRLKYLASGLLESDHDQCSHNQCPQRDGITDSWYLGDDWHVLLHVKKHKKKNVQKSATNKSYSITRNSKIPLYFKYKEHFWNTKHQVTSLKMH